MNIKEVIIWTLMLPGIAILCKSHYRAYQEHHLKILVVVSGLKWGVQKMRIRKSNSISLWKAMVSRNWKTCNNQQGADNMDTDVTNDNNTTIIKQFSRFLVPCCGRWTQIGTSKPENRKNEQNVITESPSEKPRFPENGKHAMIIKDLIIWTLMFPVISALCNFHYRAILRFLSIWS